MLRKILRDEVVEPLRVRLAERLGSVSLFGSAVPYLEDPDLPLLANVNLLVVVDGFDLEVSEAIRAVLAPRDQDSWMVTLMAEAELGEMAQVFPVEMLELVSRHVCLFGRDPLARLHVPGENREQQIRFEVLSKRQALRNLLLVRAPSEAEVGERLLSMAQAFGPLARGLLATRGIEVEGLEAVLVWLGTRAGLSPAGAEAVRDLQATREDRRRPAAGEKRTILEAFLEAWDCLAALPGAVRRRALPGSGAGRRRLRPSLRGRRRDRRR